MSVVSPDDGPGRREPCVARLLEVAAARVPDAIAILAPGRAPLTYGRLYHHVHGVCRTLNALGVGRNDRVALIVPDAPEMAVAFVAVAASASCAPLNPAYRANEFDSYLSGLRAKAVIIQSGIDSPASFVAQQRGIPIITLTPNLTAEAGIFTLSGGMYDECLNRGFAQPDDVALVLHTSGTTSRPKLVPLRHTNICTSAHTIATTLELSPRDRCLNVMPLYHIHGLIGATLSTLTAGAAMVCPPGFTATDFFTRLEEFRPSWYTAVPTIHQLVLSQTAEYSSVIKQHPLRFIRSCSAPLPPQVMVELERVFNAPVIEAYGMTEASHQICSNPLPPGVRKVGSVGVATGCEVAVVDDVGAPVAPGELGEIVVRGANVTAGYETGPAEGPASFIHGWVRTGDQGLLDPDGYLFIKGRLKEIINRGGTKISPREIEEVLLDHPTVKQAAAFGIPHSTLGEDVAAAVVLRHNADVTEAIVRQFAALRLADFKVPRRVLIVDDIPKGPTGKPQRAHLAEKFRPLLRGPEFVAPEDPLELQLQQIWENILGIRPIGVADDFFDLGGHSLLAVQLMQAIEAGVGRRLPLSTLYEGATIQHVAQTLRQQPAGAWVPATAFHADGFRPPLFFLHGDYNGGGFYCRNLAQVLGPDQPFFALHPHGLDGRPVPDTIEVMATDHLTTVRALQPHGPYRLGGHCNGGLIAFEMARRLQSQGERVEFLAVLDASAGNARFGARLLRRLVNSFGTIGGSTPPERLVRWRRTLALSGWARERARYYTHLSRDDWVAILRRKARRSRDALAGMFLRRRNSATPIAAPASRSPETGRPGQSRSTSTEEIYLQAIAWYIPGRYRGTITLFRSGSHRGGPADLGWRIVAPRVEVHEIPGDHLTSITRHVQVVGERLRACLQNVQET